MIQILAYDFILIALLTLAACIAISYTYLLSQKDANYNASIWFCMWPDLIFRFRDYTRKKSSKLYYLYYVAISALMVFIGSIFTFVLHEIFLLESPLRYIALFASFIPICLTVAVWISMAKVKYY